MEDETLRKAFVNRRKNQWRAHLNVCWTGEFRPSLCFTGCMCSARAEPSFFLYFLRCLMHFNNCCSHSGEESAAAEAVSFTRSLPPFYCNSSWDPSCGGEPVFTVSLHRFLGGGVSVVIYRVENGTPSSQHSCVTLLDV